MIPHETVDKIISSAHVEDIVGEFVNLKRRGVNLIGLCPFHNEKTPSFVVSPSKDLYKCFGCGKAGNSVRFLMDHEKYSYPEALKYLAAKYNITIEEEEVTDEQRLERDELSSIYIVLNFAQEFYHDFLLNQEEGKNIGQAYLKERGINASSVTHFKIGYSPSQKDAFSKAALAKGYKAEFLVAAGLSIKTQEGGLIDRFRDRIMFPILSVSGRALGFGGRTLKSNPTEAKYINSPETKVYSKSKILYGIHQAKNSIQKQAKLYLVEGYTDVVALYQAGFENVVASLGTSLTEDHTRLVKRYTNNLTFVFDGDEAGIKASLRGIDIALKQELNIRIIALPDGEDPDTYCKKHEKTDLNLFFKKNSVDFILFKSRFLYGESPNDPIQKAEAVRNIIKSIIQIPNHINRSSYLKELSTELDIEEEILYRELNNQLRAKRSKTSVSPRQDHKENEQPSGLEEKLLKGTTTEQERNIINLLLLVGKLAYNPESTCADVIFNNIMEYEWENHIYKSVFDHYVKYWQENKSFPEIVYFTRSEETYLQEIATEAAFMDVNLSENWTRKTGREVMSNIDFTRDVDSALKHLEIRKLQSLMKENQKKMRQSDLSDEESVEYLKIHKKLSERINEISRQIGIVIY
ncbi:DNA primase [Bacteroidota bacterium]